jgi:hypothetical protein
MAPALLHPLVASRDPEPAAGAVIYSNGFENDLTDWDAFGGIFNATRVASGTHGIVSAAGGFHAENSPCGAASRWGGYNFGAGNAVPTVFQDYTTSVAIYLDVTGGWTNNTRFDFDSAINNAAGTFQRDFIFNAGFFDDADGSPGSGTARFVISASHTGQPGCTCAKNPANAPIAIATAGWFTFEHHFHSRAGLLAVDMSIFDAARTLVKTWKLRTTDLISATGGNCYGWFNYNQFPVLAFDNAELRINNPAGCPAVARRHQFSLVVQ